MLPMHEAGMVRVQVQQVTRTTAMTGPIPGLCGGCRYARRIETTRGSTFWLCRLSETDRRYPRYPALPVVTCAGFEPLDRSVPHGGWPAPSDPVEPA
jgi:hypothetical protein